MGGGRKKIKRLHTIWRKLSRDEQEKELDDLVKKYGWFNEIEGDKPFDKEHYKKKILEFQEEKKQYLAMNIPQEVRKIGGLIGELGFLRFWNRYHFMTIRYHLQAILKELVKRSKEPTFEFATVDEMNRYFHNEEVHVSEMNERKNGYASCLVDGHTKIFTGKDAKELEELVKEDFTKMREVRGSVANKGIVRGKVRIISFVADDYNEQVKSFEKDEILVTGMTRPQIVHLCKKASAIITDEGGITSHAAVVSRELNIPCIIATHNATKVFKTGDLVEVDANSGIVTLLS